MSGRSDIALDAAGLEQARRLTARLSALPVAAVHSSPRARACETARPIAERHGLSVTLCDALDEVDFGAWAGRSFADLADDPEWHHWNTARAVATCPGGETMRAAVDRAVRHVEAIDGSEGAVVCVSHCDIIRGIVAHYLGLDLDRLLAFDVDPGSITTLATYAGGGRVVALNERSA